MLLEELEIARQNDLRYGRKYRNRDDIVWVSLSPNFDGKHVIIPVFEYYIDNKWEIGRNDIFYLMEDPFIDFFSPTFFLVEKKVVIDPKLLGEVIWAEQQKFYKLEIEQRKLIEQKQLTPKLVKILINRFGRLFNSLFLLK